MNVTRGLVLCEERYYSFVFLGNETFSPKIFLCTQPSVKIVYNNIAILISWSHVISLEWFYK
jgi:hypothetical protein